VLIATLSALATGLVNWGVETSKAKVAELKKPKKDDSNSDEEADSAKEK
jgi:hypothetical protein